MFRDFFRILLLDEVVSMTYPCYLPAPPFVDPDVPEEVEMKAIGLVGSCFPLGRLLVHGVYNLCSKKEIFKFYFLVLGVATHWGLV